jgi:hypothetical protein
MAVAQQVSFWSHFVLASTKPNEWSWLLVNLERSTPRGNVIDSGEGHGPTAEVAVRKLIVV